MELRHLRYFVALAQHMNFTIAAQAVHVAQSTLSHQIRQLEEEIGAELFERVRGRVIQLTAAGSTFATYASNALREVDEGLWRLKPEARQEGGVFRVATIQAANMVQVPRAVLRFIEQFPNVRVTVREVSNDAALDAVLEGDADFAIVNTVAAQKSLHFEHLYTEELAIVVAKHHPLARRKTVRMVEVHRLPMVLFHPKFPSRRMLDQHFHSARAEPNVMAEVDTIPSTLEMVAGGHLATILPRSTLSRGDLVAIPIESPTPVRTPGMVWKRDAGSRAFIRTFADLVRQSTTDELADQRQKHRGRAARAPRPRAQPR